MPLEPGADVAILQQRDVFRADQIGNVEAQSRDLREIVERTLWKGDFLLKVPVKGSVLISVMEQSAALAQYTLAAEEERLEDSRPGSTPSRVRRFRSPCAQVASITRKAEIAS